jgi:hypothetical protein
MAQKTCSLLTSPAKSQLLLTCGYSNTDYLSPTGKNIAAILRKNNDSYSPLGTQLSSALDAMWGLNPGPGNGTCGVTPTNTAKSLETEIPLSWWKT